MRSTYRRTIIRVCANCSKPRRPGISSERAGPARVTPPVPLAAGQGVEDFDSGVAPLEEWLKRRARQNEASGASRTYVIAEGRRVVGYYSLAAGAVLHEAATGRVRRNMPDPVPAALLGRLAVDQGWQGRGLGSALLRDAVLRVFGAPRRSVWARCW